MSVSARSEKNLKHGAFGSHRMIISSSSLVGDGSQWYRTVRHRLTFLGLEGCGSFSTYRRVRTVPYPTVHSMYLMAVFSFPPNCNFEERIFHVAIPTEDIHQKRPFQRSLPSALPAVQTICIFHLFSPLQSNVDRAEPNRTESNREPLRSVGSRRLLLAQWMDRRLILFFSIHSTVP